MKLINPEIRFEVTNKCNARCIMCPRDKMKRPQGVLDLDLYKMILDEAVCGGVKQVCLENFGESFLDPFIFERANYARDKGLLVYTVTNASLIDKAKISKILKCFDKIRISMYGTTKKTYEKIHRGLCFEQVQKNVDLLLEMRNQNKSSLQIDMSFLLMDENRDEMKEFMERYEKLVDNFSVWRLHNWGDGKNYREILSKKKSCGRPFTGPIQVQWDGLVVPCCFDYDSKIVLGDLNKQTLHEVLHGEKFEEIRRSHRVGDFSAFPLCNICDQLNKREDVLVYSKSNNCKVGVTYSTNFDLMTKVKKDG